MRKALSFLIQRSVPESALVRQILEALAFAPDLLAWRNNTGALPNPRGQIIHFGRPGSPDIEGILAPKGRHFALEVKRLGELPRGNQRAALSQIRQYGGFACVVHCVSEALEALDRARRGESE